MIESEKEIIVNDLMEKISDEEVNNIVNYIEKSFDDTPNSSVQLANMVKLSNFLNKNGYVVEEIESEKLLSRSFKLNNTLYSFVLSNSLIILAIYLNPVKVSNSFTL